MEHQSRMQTMSSKGLSKNRRTGMSIRGMADDLVSQLDEQLVRGKHFVLLEKGESIPKKKAEQLWGIIRIWPQHGRIVAIKLNHLHRLTPAAVLPKVLRFLVRQGIVLPGIDGTLTRQVMIQGRACSARRRYVVFVEKVLVERASTFAAIPPPTGNRRLSLEDRDH